MKLSSKSGKNADSKEEGMILRPVTKFGYSIGHILNDLAASLWFTYGLLFFNYVVKFSHINAGVIILIGQLADAAATPLVGIASDRQIFMTKYGKRKTWHAIGTLGILLTLPFMFSPCIECTTASETVQMVYYSGFIIIFQWAWAFVQISHLSLAPDLTPNKNERTQLLSLRTTFAVLSNISVYSVAWAVFEVDASGSTQIDKTDMIEFQIITYSICGIGLLSSVLFHILVKETPPEESLLNSNAQARRNSYKSIFSKVAVYQVAVLYLCARLYGNMIQSLIPLYIHDVLRLKPQFIAAVPFVMYIASFLTSFIIGPINKRYGRKVAFCLGSLSATAGILGIAFGYGYIYNTYIIYVVAVLLGGAQCSYLVTSLSVIADLIGSDTGNGAFIYGMMSLTDKISSGAAIMIIQGLYPGGDVTNTAYYKYATVIVCGSAAVLGTIASLSVRLERSDDVTQDEPSASEPQPNA